ncbi:MAG: KpsF/GutQ family sugar-phosphate isomerase [Planctomycetota bacterium]
MSPAAPPAASLVAGAREVMRLEATALWKLSATLGDELADAIDLLRRCRGAVIVTGMGKAGLVAQKIAATLASTGQPSHFLHPAEAFHGDLGRVRGEDVVLMLSQSGETGEVVQLLPPLRDAGVPIIAVTASGQSTVGRAAEVVLPLGDLDEACSLGLAPSTSTTAMLAIGDALALVLSSARGFRAEDFARFHPGGSLGKKLARVRDAMRPLAECRVAQDNHTVREVLLECSRPGRRTGAVMLTGTDGRLTGLFTDSDLARLMETTNAVALDTPIREHMAHEPTTIGPDARMAEALRVLADRKFSELPVVGESGEPLGLIDVTDVVAIDAPAAPSPGPPSVRLFAGEDIDAAG